MSSICPFHLTAGDDFAAGPYNVNFTAGQQSATLLLPTVDDNVTELYECFKVVFVSKNIFRVINKPFSKTVVVLEHLLWVCIIDNDPGTYAHSLTIQMIVRCNMCLYSSSLLTFIQVDTVICVSLRT